MNVVGRLLIATVLLISNLSWAAVACACPPISKAVPQSAAVSTCPMSGEKNCACCLKSKPALNGELEGPSAKCQITTSHASSDTISVLVAAVELPMVLAPIAIAPTPMEAIIETATPQHLVVHRIRPPDPGLHGLRAPPAS